MSTHGWSTNGVNQLCFDGGPFELCVNVINLTDTLIYSLSANDLNVLLLMLLLPTI
jgi:hypothetical protein